MSYRGLIIKLQKLYAHYDCIRNEKDIYKPTKEQCDLICKEINNLLESEEYAMKKSILNINNERKSEEC